MQRALLTEELPSEASDVTEPEAEQQRPGSLAVPTHPVLHKPQSWN